jgi:hypothetical protein
MMPVSSTANYYTQWFDLHIEFINTDHLVNSCQHDVENLFSPLSNINPKKWNLIYFFIIKVLLYIP